MAGSVVSGHHLRRRLALALTALAAGSALLVSFSFWASEHFIEAATLDERLTLELSSLIKAGINPQQMAHGDAQLRYYRPKLGGEAPPKRLEALSPGNHEVTADNGVEEIVLVRELAPGDRALLIYQDRERATRSRWLATSLLISLALTSMAAVWMARLLAGQSLAPLHGFLDNLRRLDPEKRGQRMPQPDVDSELAVIAQSFNAYMERLDELVERERVFATAASHELRTPIAVIQGAAEVLVAQGVETPPVQRILRAADAARRDLEALLWLSRSGTTPPSELIDLAQRLPALCANQIDIHAVLWQLGASQVTAPPGAVAVVVSNLLRNALRAAPQAGGVRLRLRSGEVLVEDDGPGVAPELIDKIFQPGISGSDGGTGMGLYIAKAIAKRLGWQLSLSNRPEGGAVARLTFLP